MSDLRHLSRCLSLSSQSTMMKAMDNIELTGKEEGISYTDLYRRFEDIKAKFAAVSSELDSFLSTDNKDESSR
ncbi:hypothetical protein SAMN02745225_02264 [Ferrithrix thermotolerans DSM 19514]|jgi:predicted NACHT family NTPase|uniref:Uncharacterized protein n=2 Tax=Ferrithrix TaxID=643949 RepID=A0A1M4Y791_9ACTN|nr:hypothetical protein SAMN02745225_02264 [Ferrithrix thermotolerans DSM 19514]